MADISLKQEVYRKLIHMTSLWMVAAMYWLNWQNSVLLFGTLSIVVISLDYLRKKSKVITKIFNFFFGNVLRAKEKKKTLTGASYVAPSALLSIILFDKDIALAAFSSMIIGDALAALMGRAFGVMVIYDKKTVVGSGTFLIASFCCIYFFTGQWYFAIAGASIGTVVELFAEKCKIDDNLAIPLAIGVCLNFII